MKFDLAEIQKRIDAGLITRQSHPKIPLDIYNYTPKAQHGCLWDEYTTRCRGLILDREGNVVANPFPKFFNLNTTPETKIENLPAEVPIVSEKLDGCFGVQYINDGDCAIATRGSFTSEQAVWASKWIRRKGFIPSMLKVGYTYLFEIVYPDDPHVVQYGKRAECILLAVRETETGKELDHVVEAERLGLSYAKVYPVAGSTDEQINYLQNILKASKGTDFEGFVCKYRNGLRVKIKSEDYFRLHRLFFQTSTTSIWESLMKTGKLDAIIEKVPDELHQWIKYVEQGLRDEHAEILQYAAKIHSEVVKQSTRKEQALYLKQFYPDMSGVVFSLLDNRPKAAENAAWMRIKPEWQVFKRESVEDA